MSGAVHARALQSGKPWTASQRSVEEEIQRLRDAHRVGFEYESHEIKDGVLNVLGSISHIHEHGGEETLRVRLQYPYHYGRELSVWEFLAVARARNTDTIAVFDEDKVFTPGIGHMFPNHQLCLEYPFRRELARDPSSAAEDVLGASVMWLLKRNMFERSGRRTWPGEAEEHGYSLPAKATAISAARSVGADVEIWAAISIDLGIPPKFAEWCPCGSRKPLFDCHRQVGQLVLVALYYKGTGM